MSDLSTVNGVNRSSHEGSISLQVILGDHRGSGSRSSLASMGSIRRRLKRRAPLPPGMRENSDSTVLRIDEPSDLANPRQRLPIGEFDLDQPLVELSNIASQLKKIEQTSFKLKNPFDDGDEDDDYDPSKNPFSDGKDAGLVNVTVSNDDNPFSPHGRNSIRRKRPGFQSYLRSSADESTIKEFDTITTAKTKENHTRLSASIDGKNSRPADRTPADGDLRKNVLLAMNGRSDGYEKSVSGADLRKLTSQPVPSRTSSFVSTTEKSGVLTPEKTVSVDIRVLKEKEKTLSRADSTRHSARAEKTERPQLMRTNSENQKDKGYSIRRLRERVSVKFHRPENLNEAAKTPEKPRPAPVGSKPRLKVQVPTSSSALF